MPRVFPSGLKLLYARMIREMFEGKTGGLRMKVLSIAALAFRPVHFNELARLAGLPSCDQKDVEYMCGSFLTIREGTVYFIHHSAKDFLSAHRLLFPKGRAEVHCEIVSRSLQAMDETLDRDIYGQQHPGVLINEGNSVNPDPLDQIRYSCAYWINHVSEIDKSLHYRIGLHDNGKLTHS